MGMAHRPTAIWMLLAVSLALVFFAGSASKCVAAAAPSSSSDIQSQITEGVAKLPLSKEADFLRWQIIQLCLELPQPESTPSEAQNQAAQGYYFFTHATRTNGASDYEKAADAYARASLVAPCVPNYYYNRATALRQALKYGGSTQDAKDAAMSLHWYLAANSGDSQADKGNIVRAIGNFEAQASVKTDTDLGWVPLVWAAADGEVEPVRALLADGAEANATVNFYGRKGVSALEAAAAFGSVDIVKLLLTHGAEIDARDDSDGKNALNVAAAHGNIDVVAYLVSHGANINSRDKRGSSPLSRAACYSPFPVHLAVVKYLVSAGANIELTDDDGETPLMVAVQCGSIDATRYLISAGADVNARDKHGNTPLMWAVDHDNLDTVKLLISNGAKVDTADEHDLTPLYFAASSDSLPVAQYLVEHGADVNWVSNQKNYLSVLGIAVQNGPLDIVKYLVSVGADVNVQQNDGSTPLITAAQNDQPQIVQFLLSHHAKVDAADSEGMTALYWAAVYGYVDNARILVKHDANVNWSSSDQNQDNVLCLAAYHGHLKMVKFLVAHGANVNTQMKDGETPLDCANDSYDKANMNDKIAVADYLSSKGGETGQVLDSGAVDITTLLFLLLAVICTFAFRVGELKSQGVKQDAMRILQ